ncbi:MAG: hypothetical protein IPM34_09225 [Saprospiraceae bacterium]|nr:hypothetical protein [Saprospiraceae bacterium]
MRKQTKQNYQGVRFYYQALANGRENGFQRLFSLFNDIFLATSGDLKSSFQWLNDIDRNFGIFTENYRLPDFIEDLKRKGFTVNDPDDVSMLSASSKFEINLRELAFRNLFGKLSRGKGGKHLSRHTGKGDEINQDLRSFQFGDSYSQIEATETLKNLMIRNGMADTPLNESDLTVYDSYQSVSCCTVLMIDISHSMVLYGEDRITPAKKVALALTQMIQSCYPKDQLHIVVFGDDAWSIPVSEIPYIEVGPYHTNTVDGLNLSLTLLNKSRCPNKNIMMITDGKPSCIKRGKEYYKNPYGLDPYIIRRTLSMARKCRKQHIDITTFMLTSDPYLVEFVDRFSKEAQGKALYTQLDNLGQQIMIHYQNNRKKNSGK